MKVGGEAKLYDVEKSARLTAGSTLTLWAESIGEVTGIFAKEWQKVKKWAKLVTLKDSVNSYDLRLAQAENGLNVQDASIEATKISLDRTITDSQVAYLQAKRSYETLIAKNPLAYDTIVNTNQKTLDNLDPTYRTYLSDIEKTLNQITYEADRILGISTVFQYANDNFEPYLWNRNGSVKVDADNSYGRAITILGEIRAMKDIATTPETATKDIARIQSGYTLGIELADNMIKMIQNNVIAWALVQEMNDGWLAQWTGFRSQLQGSNTAFSAWKTQTLNFLKNYKLNELAVKVAIESLKRELTPQEKELINNSTEARLLYNTNIIDLKDRIKAAELAMKQAEAARETAIKSKAATLAQLAASRNGTAISVEQARREYEKLIVTSPINGTVTKIITSVGQSTNMGTPMMEIVSDNPEVVIDLDASIVNNLSVWDTVTVKTDGGEFKGFVTAISRSAWANLLYTTRISVPEATKYIGSAASIVFSASEELSNTWVLDTIILPLKSVKIISEQEGEIALLGKNDTLELKTVRLGKIVGDWVTIEDILPSGTIIILSDISNYDKDKFFFEKLPTK